MFLIILFFKVSFKSKVALYLLCTVHLGELFMCTVTGTLRNLFACVYCFGSFSSLKSKGALKQASNYGYKVSWLYLRNCTISIECFASLQLFFFFFAKSDSGSQILAKDMVLGSVAKRLEH